MADCLPKTCVQLEIPADCRGMKATVNIDQEVLFEFGDFPYENYILFHSRRALQQFIDLAVGTLEAPSADTEQTSTTAERAV